METSKIIFIVFSATMFLFSFMVPGLLLMNASTSKPNNIIGFRTKRAFLSKETWAYANKEAGSLFIKTGIAYLAIISLILLISFFINLKDIFGEIYVIIPVIVPAVFIPYIIIKVQNGLKDNFDDNGAKL